jgi:transposase-like protein
MNHYALFEGPRMKPLSYYQQIVRMPNRADKFDLRLRKVKHALAYGVKPTARLFDTTPKTVRKWVTRYHQERLAGLNELPRIPLHCPHKTSKHKGVYWRKRGKKWAAAIRCNNKTYPTLRSTFHPP